MESETDGRCLARWSACSAEGYLAGSQPAQRWRAICLDESGGVATAQWYRSLAPRARRARRRSWDPPVGADVTFPFTERIGLVRLLGGWPSAGMWHEGSTDDFVKVRRKTAVVVDRHHRPLRASIDIERERNGSNP